MKDPRRRPINAFERNRLNLDALQSKIATITCPLRSWEVREGRFLRPGHYDWPEPWRPYESAQLWGGEDISAQFRGSFTVPPDFAGRPLWLHIYPGG